MEAAERVEENLGYRFADRSLLREALLHRSYAGEHQDTISYERLEFLGDAVLQLAVTDYVYDRWPGMTEGEMAKVRASVVSEQVLARIGRSLEVGPAILLGRGEELAGGADKDSLVSDVVEALVGAVSVELGFVEAAALIIRHWGRLIDRRAVAPGQRDFKTRLQEMLARDGVRPTYEVHEEGPAHAKRFSARVLAGGRLLGEGTGTSKKRAKQAAAEQATDSLDADA